MCVVTHSRMKNKLLQNEKHVRPLPGAETPKPNSPQTSGPPDNATGSGLHDAACCASDSPWLELRQPDDWNAYLSRVIRVDLIQGFDVIPDPYGYTIEFHHPMGNFSLGEDDGLDLLNRVAGLIGRLPKPLHPTNLALQRAEQITHPREIELPPSRYGKTHRPFEPPHPSRRSEESGLVCYYLV
jgi:hypothetical protein